MPRTALLAVVVAAILGLSGIRTPGLCHRLVLRMPLDESYPGIQLTTARKAGDLLTVTDRRRARSCRGPAAGRDLGVGGTRSAAGEGAGQEGLKMCAKCNRQERGCRPARFLPWLPHWLYSAAGPESPDSPPATR